MTKWPEDRFGKSIPFSKRTKEERLEIIERSKQALMDEWGLTEEQARLAVRRWRKSVLDET